MLSSFEGMGLDKFADGIDVGIALNFFVGHVAESAAVAGGAPGGGFRRIERETVRYGAAKFFSVGYEAVDGCDVVLLKLNVFGKLREVFLSGVVVVLKLAADVFAGLADEMAMVQPIDAGFEHESQEEADGNDGDVGEEVSPGVHGLMGGVDVHENSELFCGCGCSEGRLYTGGGDGGCWGELLSVLRAADEVGGLNDFLHGGSGSEIREVLIDPLQPRATAVVRLENILGELDLGLELGGSEVRDIGVNEGILLRLSDGAVEIDLRGFQDFELGIERIVFGDLILRHESGDAGLSGRLPRGFGDGLVVSAPDDDAGQFFFGRAGVLLQVNEDEQVVLHESAASAKVDCIHGKALPVVLALDAESFASFFHFVAVMQQLDAGFKAERDEQTDGDGDEMKEEIFPGVDGIVGCVDVHGWLQ